MLIYGKLFKKKTSPKILLLTFTSFILALTTMFILSTSLANAATVKSSNNSPNHNSLKNKQVTTFIPKNKKHFIQKQGWEKPNQNAELVKVVRVNDKNTNNINNKNNVSTFGWYYKIKNVDYRGQTCGTKVQARTSGTGGADGDLILKQTVSVSNSFSTNVNVSASTVSAGVGFNVTKTISRTTGRTVHTHGKSYQIIAYDDFETKHFQVYNLFGSKVGDGMAFRQVGFCYAIYQT